MLDDGSMYGHSYSDDWGWWSSGYDAPRGTDYWFSGDNDFTFMYQSDGQYYDSSKPSTMDYSYSGSYYDYSYSGSYDSYDYSYSGSYDYSYSGSYDYSYSGSYDYSYSGSYDYSYSY